MTDKWHFAEHPVSQEVLNDGVRYPDGPLRFEFDDEGHMTMRGTAVRQHEPVCPKCHEPIRYVLDVASWEDGSHYPPRLCHARCLWLRDGLIREAKRAIE